MHIKYIQNIISFWLLSSAFRRLVRYNPRYACIVYRLINGRSYEMFLILNTHFIIKILVKCTVYLMLGAKGIYFHISDVKKVSVDLNNMTRFYNTSTHLKCLFLILHRGLLFTRLPVTR